MYTVNTQMLPPSSSSLPLTYFGSVLTDNMPVLMVVALAGTVNTAADVETSILALSQGTRMLGN